MAGYGTTQWTPHYIDTWSGRGLFSPPSGIESYDAWLLARYRESPGVMQSGVAQRINEILFGMRNIGCRAIAIGPYAADAAVVIEYLSGWTVEVEVQ